MNLPSLASHSRRNAFVAIAAGLALSALGLTSCGGGGSAAACPTGLSGCANGCTDTATDPMNCGACGIACATGDVCSHGECIVACPAGSVECNGTCTVLATDDANCGTCGNACAPGEVCAMGACAETCSKGYSACPATGMATYCADLTSDPANCGTCGTACPAGELCSTGKCTATCGGGDSTCPGTGAGPYCANLQTDVANCGGCGDACTAGQTCVSGKCTCPTADPDACGTGVGAFCTNLETDSAHCGACGTACPTGMVCSAGACAATCTTGWTACPATGTPTYCADTMNDAANCGGCGMPCPTGQSCVSGACAPVCETGFTACGGACVDLTSDADDCGVCGNSCPSGDRCSGGACVAAVAVGYWPFEGDLVDRAGSNPPGIYLSGTAPVPPTFAPGYAGQGLQVNVTQTNWMQIPSPVGLPLGNTARTLEAWVYPTALLDVTYNGIVAYGQEAADAGQLLSLDQLGHVTSANWDDDLIETYGPEAPLNAWSHVAYVMWPTSSTTEERELWLNGRPVAGQLDKNTIDTLQGTLRVGCTDYTPGPGRCFSGIIDEVRIYDYARRAQDILDDATLEAHYSFDAGLGLDSGPNHLQGTVTGTTTIPGRLGQAIGTSGSATSYFQAGGFTGMAPVRQAFTIDGWINPSADSGVLFYMSQSSDGSGNCIPYLGFSGGQLVGRVWNGSDQTVTAPASIPTGTWTHVAVTWDPSGNLDLYVNGALVGSQPGTVNALNGPATYLTLGSTVTNATCDRGMGDYAGGFDDVRLYTRALTPTEIAAQASP